MAENSSGFVDFQTYSDLNGDEESRLMEEAYQRAMQADETARTSLSQAYRDTQGAGSTIDALSKSASYSDYLKAADDAKKQWAAIFRDGADPRGSALRGSLRAKMEAGDKMAASQTELASRESEFGKRVGENFAGAQQNRAEQAAYKQRMADEEKLRAEKEAEGNKRHAQNVWNTYFKGTAHGQAVQDNQLQARYLQQMGMPRWNGAPQFSNYGPQVAGVSFRDQYEVPSIQRPGMAKTKAQQEIEANPWAGFEPEEES